MISCDMTDVKLYGRAYLLKAEYQFLTKCFRDALVEEKVCDDYESANEEILRIVDRAIDMDNEVSDEEIDKRIDKTMEQIANALKRMFKEDMGDED